MPDSHHREDESYILDRSSPLLNVFRHSTQARPLQQTQQQQQQTIEPDQDIDHRPSHKRQRSSYNSSRFTLPLRPTTSSPFYRSLSELTPSSLANDPNPPNEMSDGSMSKRSSRSPAAANRESENEARALRVLEIMNDFRTLQVHITSMCTRAEANPPDQASYYLDGYALLRQCNAEAQAILATNYNPGSLGIGPGVRVPDTEVQKATLQR